MEIVRHITVFIFTNVGRKFEFESHATNVNIMADFQIMYDLMFSRLKFIFLIKYNAILNYPNPYILFNLLKV